MVLLFGVGNKPLARILVGNRIPGIQDRLDARAENSEQVQEVVRFQALDDRRQRLVGSGEALLLSRCRGGERDPGPSPEIARQTRIQGQYDRQQKGPDQR